jgi:Uma2 family endonuclease
LYDKKQVYRRNGVQEYIVWQVFDRKIDWFSLQAGEYVPLHDRHGVVQSRVFPGLWLAIPSLLTGEMTKAIALLQLGLNSSDRAQFVELLSNRLS